MSESRPKHARATCQDILDAPRIRTLEAYQLRDGAWSMIRVLEDVERARIAPFDAIELDLATSWQDLPLSARVSEGAASYEVDW